MSGNSGLKEIQKMESLDCDLACEFGVPSFGSDLASDIQ